MASCSVYNTAIMYQSGEHKFLPLEEDPDMFQILITLLAVLSACVGSGELDTAVDDSGCFHG